MFRSQHWRRRLAPVLVGLVASVLSACETSVSAKHDPIYRAATHSSTISAEGRNNEVGLDRIEIEVTRGTMTDCSELGGGPSLIPCRSSATTIVHTCSYTGAPSTAACDFNFTLGNQEIVTYRARAVPTSGSTRSSQTITYSGGFPPVADIARPVWWHTDAPAGSAANNRIDLGFFPDADYAGFYTSFTNDMQTIVDGAFFNTTGVPPSGGPI